MTPIARGSYRNKEAADIHGSGYVVHSLEAALWVFSRTNNFADAILMAANLGEDADTTAAVCGRTRWGFTMANRRFLHTGSESVWRFDRRLLNWLTSFGAAPYEPASRRGKNITTAEADLR